MTKRRICNHGKRLYLSRVWWKYPLCNWVSQWNGLSQIAEFSNKSEFEKFIKLNKPSDQASRWSFDKFLEKKFACQTSRIAHEMWYKRVRSRRKHYDLLLNQTTLIILEAPTKYQFMDPWLQQTLKTIPPLRFPPLTSYLVIHGECQQKRDWWMHHTYLWIWI